ncbi:MAG: MBL fold metallo-hydrolase, partial [Alphaproteobacteria bacterium]
MKVTILGCGSSGGVPRIGGTDGQGDWGACDPAEPRNRRRRCSILVENGPTRVLV